MRRALQFVITAAAALPALVPAGCADSGTPGDSSRPTSLPPPGPKQVLVHGAAVASGDETRPTSEQFAEQVRKALARPNEDALRRLIARRPDSALELLRETSPEDGVRPDRTSVAAAYDALFDSSAEDGWSVALRRQTTDIREFTGFRRARSQLLSHIAAGKPEEAAKVDMVAALPVNPPSALAVEARRLAGLAAFLSDEPARAVQQWSAAAELGAAGPRHVRMEIQLLLSEAARRSRRVEQASAAWRAAGVAGVGVNDPELWERALAGRPVGTPWPEAVIAAWRAGTSAHDDLKLAAGAEPAAADVLMRIGRMRLARRSPQAALLAFSRAESETDDPRLSALARIHRVHVMIGLQQPGSAGAMLEELVRHRDPTVARRAQAMMGYIQCRYVDSKRGLATLREAVAAADGGEWPDKSRSMADLGLCLLLAGQEKDGLTWLHEAQFRFEREGLLEDLAQSLANEFEYLLSVEKPQEAERIRLRADELNRKLGLPPTKSRTANG